MKKLAATLLVISFFFISETQAQGKIFDRMSVEDGLSSNYLNVVIQDTDGFIWMGTNNGLNRYDGYKFKTFVTDENDSTSISNNWITCMLEDEKGNFWIGTEGGGLNYYDQSSGEFIRYLHDPKNRKSISSDVIIQLFQDSEQRIWIGTREGIDLFDPTDNTFENWNDYKNCDQCTHSVTSIAEDSQGNLWIGDEIHGLYYFDHRTKFFSTPHRENMITDQDNLFVNDLILQGKHLYIGTANGLAILNTTTNRFEEINISQDSQVAALNDFIVRLYTSAQDEIWICTDGSGLGFYDRKTNKMELYNSSHGLSGNSVADITIDYSNNLWVGTRGGGMNKFNLKNRMFRHWGVEPDNKNSLVQNEVRALHQDNDGIIWIGTNNGLSRFDGESGIFKNYVEDFDYKADASAPRIRLIHRDQTNTLWVSSQSGGFYRYLPQEDRFILDPTYLKSTITNDVRKVASLYEVSDDVLWLCTDGSGVLEYDKRAGNIERIRATNDYQNQLSKMVINSVVKKSDNEVWLGTDAGLILINQQTLQIQQWQKEKGNSSSLVGNKIRSMYQDDQGRLWIGTRSGLSLFEISSKKFRQFKMRDGLPSEIVFGILPGVDGKLWLSTTNGLSQVDPVSLEFKNIAIPQNNALDMGAHSIGLDGDLIVGGTAGFTVFNPSDLKKNPYVPQVVFLDVKVGKESLNTSEVSTLNDLELKHHQNNLTFEFSALEFSDEEKNQYEYFLEGFNDDWVSHGNRHEVTFTNLDPGDYVLHIRGSNNDGIRDENGVSLAIAISPPWWATWWFRAIMVLTAISGVIFYNRWKVRKIEADKRHLKSKIDEATSQVVAQNAELELQKNTLIAAIHEINDVVSDAVQSGNFKARIDIANKSGEWKNFGLSINNMFESVTKPFNEINRIVNKMAEGDLTLRFTEKAHGDIKVLADNLNKALDILVDLLMDISGQVDIISTSSEDMLLNTKEMNGSTAEIANAVGEMSDGAQKQVNKVEESSILIEGILKFSGEMKNQAEAINDATARGVQKSVSGMEQIGKLDDKMKDILDHSGRTNQSINTLKKRSEEINAVLRIIKDVAAQTNLLALNAAIEAAQAGDAGRGFAVVAEEIRKLAEDSKKSAGEIEGLVLGVQKDTTSTAELISQMSTSIEEGGEATKESLKAFEEISSGYNETLEKSESIVKATDRQTDDLKGVVDMINEIVVIAEETATGTEQTASSSSELSTGMENYTLRSQKVSDITQDLRRKMGKFKLETNTTTDPSPTLEDIPSNGVVSKTGNDRLDSSSISRQAHTRHSKMPFHVRNSLKQKDKRWSDSDN